MFDKIKLLASDTIMYGVSTILGRFLTFLLVPFYTNVLSPGEYGIVSYIFSFIAFLNVLFGYGMESAYFRYATSLEIGGKKQNFSVPFASLFITSILFALCILGFARLVATVLAIPAEHTPIVYYSAWILCFDALALIPFAFLRIERKAKKFASLKLLNIVITVTLNVILLIKFHFGVEGIFISNLVASVVTFLVLLPTIFKNFSFDLSKPLYKALLLFGLPYVPAGIATMMVQVIDRPILRAMTDDATVGIYQANYRLGIFMMILVSIFDYAWRPFFLSHAKEENAKQLFARILTYFLVLMTFVFLIVSLFIDEIVKIHFFGHSLIHPNYWGGLSIVPIVLAAYMCLGISNNMVAGIYIEKKTSWLPAITFLGAGVNVTANILMIPYYGITGAAWATFFSYFLMAIALYFVVQRFYPVKYEFARMAKIALAGSVIFLFAKIIPIGAYSLFLNIGLIAVFFLLMYWFRFFEGRELGIVHKVWKGISSSKEELNNKEPGL